MNDRSIEVRAGNPGAQVLLDLAEHLHPIDSLEAKATAFTSNHSALLQGVLDSTEVFTAFDTYGRAVALFGVAPITLTSRVGRPWLLRRADSYLFARAYVSLTRRYIDRWHQQYPILENWCSDQATDTKRWLTWAGFTVEQAQPVGFNGELLCRFSKGSNNVHGNGSSHRGVHSDDRILAEPPVSRAAQSDGATSGGRRGER